MTIVELLKRHPGIGVSLWMGELRWYGNDWEVRDLSREEKHRVIYRGSSEEAAVAALLGEEK